MLNSFIVIYCSDLIPTATVLNSLHKIPKISRMDSIKKSIKIKYGHVGSVTNQRDNDLKIFLKIKQKITLPF